MILITGEVGGHDVCVMEWRPLIGQMRTWKSVTDQTCLVTITNINSQFHQQSISIEMSVSDRGKSVLNRQKVNVCLRQFTFCQGLASLVLMNV